MLGILFVWFSGVEFCRHNFIQFLVSFLLGVLFIVAAIGAAITSECGILKKVF